MHLFSIIPVDIKRVANGIYLERGALIKRKYTVPFENVSTITVDRNIFAAILMQQK